MLTIRLSRTGKKKQPQYRVVLQENHRDPWSPAKEILGHYNPRAKENNIVLEGERIKYWISVGAKPSATVHNMLINAEIIKAEKEGVVTISKKRTAKLAEKKVAKEEKDAEAKEAKKAAKEAEAAKAKEEKEAAEAKKVEEAEKVKEFVEVKEEVKEVAETPAEETPAADAKEETPAKIEEKPTEETPAEKTAE
ncbi:30S ribosomal protein S16 [Candidatus Uhrbacteria bacterium]|nr:30S ribosomal protein S16 [Candidatus Uhrbacteria bacterium]